VGTQPILVGPRREMSRGLSRQSLFSDGRDVGVRNLGEQLTGAHAKGEREESDILQRWVPLTALDTAYIVAVHVAALREVFLTEARVLA
jgi:hypothetical protein